MLLDLATTLGTIASAWGLCAVTLLGLGAAPAWWMGVRRFDFGLSVEMFWLGLPVAVTFLQIWHLFAPIGGYSALALMALATPGMAFIISAARSSGRMPSRAHWVWTAAALAVCLWVTDRAIGNRSPQTDAALYHLPSVTWAQSFAAVPGLGNLNDRLGFNNASFLVAAALGTGPWAGRAHHLLNGILLLGVVALSFRGLREVYGGSRRPQPLSVFECVLLVPCSMLLADTALFTSLSTDYAVTLVLLAASIVAARAHVKGSSETERAFRYVTVTALLTTAVCFKMNTIVFGAVSVLLMLAFRPFPQLSGRPGVLTVGLVALLAAGWCVRGVVLSGYVIYPIGITAVPVDWRVPVEAADAHRAWLGHHSRGFYGPEGWERPYASQRLFRGRWLGDWARAILRRDMGQYFIVIPSLATLAFGGAALYLRRQKSRVERVFKMLSAASVAAIAVWFVSAPTPRYASYPFWILAGCAAAVAAARYDSGAHLLHRWVVVAAGVLLVGIPWFDQMRAAMRQLGPVEVAVATVFIAPARETLFFPLPAPELKEVRTRSGLVIQVPTNYAHCWNAAPLCTPNPSSWLRLRRPGDAGGGFTVDGIWEPVQWPTPGSRFLETYRQYLATTSRNGH